jgi:hypothetical protein
LATSQGSDLEKRRFFWGKKLWISLVRAIVGEISGKVCAGELPRHDAQGMLALRF